MGGDELSFPAANFRPAFDLARSEGLRIVCHAGEIGGPESVREAMEILGAERIGHGIAVMHDAGSGRIACQLRSVVLENCPYQQSLHRRARKADRQAGGIARRSSPSSSFSIAASPVTLSTDDPAMFHTDLLAEYSHAASLGSRQNSFLQLAEQSFNAAFLAADRKAQLLDDFRAAANRGLL